MKLINNNPKRPYICPELKDKLLNILIDGLTLNKHSSLNISPLKEKMDNIDTDIIVGMLYLFNDDGLIEMLGYNRSIIDLILNPKSIEFSRIGGYTLEDELLKKQMTLLKEQIKELQSKDVIDKADGISNTVANISSLLFKFFN